MNKRRLVKWGLSFVSAAAGIVLPGLMAGEGKMSFEAQYGLAALSEILLLGIPALIFLTDLCKESGALRTAFPKQDPNRVGLAMLAAVGFTIVGMVVTVLWLTLLSLISFSPLQPVLKNPETLMQLLLAILMAAVVPAACEEMLFRGVLLRFAYRKWGEKAAVWGTAAVFAVMHFSVAGFPMLLLIGVLLARLAIKGKGLTLPFVFHAMYNLSAVVINRYGAAPGMMTVLISTVAFRWAMHRLLTDKEA